VVVEGEVPQTVEVVLYGSVEMELHLNRYHMQVHMKMVELQVEQEVVAGAA
jgi:hypothetical protein